MWRFVLLSFLIAIANAAPVKDEPTSIINGDLANIQDYPFYVYLSYKPSFALKCGGALIQPNIVLTAAHCLNSPHLYVWPGITSKDDLKGAKFYEVDDILIHPEYKLNSVYHKTVHDIGIIRLTEDVVFGDKVKLIPLAEDKPPVGEQVMALGFGLDACGELYELYENYSICSNPTSMHLRQAVFTVTSFDDSVIDSIGNSTQNSCYGDSGGPMVYDKKLIGVASEVELSDCKGENTYTRVDNHLAWIHQYIETSNKNKTYSASDLSWW